MENQKRILNFSEFTKEYSQGDRLSLQGNSEENVNRMRKESDNLTSLTSSGTIKGSKGEMDSISSMPATKKLKTDYELSPPIPNGPIKMKNVKSEESEELKEPKEKSKVPVKNIKKTKKETSKSKEDEREESGDY